ncbi:hypothetical protein MWN33_16650 [Starkeya koreensis]|uniref:Uncharacterized protein n=1 Tax=Ancylobacter koreensis TaxID=266121 RepID=A0ABT0DR47_9HYPH|nr:hypothetical protein [Ancylobacter koreensis]MCK0209664.1 hypothetical protein [Ancylobacter koreensis]
MRALRLIIAFLALTAALAGSAAGSVAMARASMPCHEPAVREVADAHGGHGGPSAHAASVAVVMGQGAALAQPPAPDAVRLHLCCVLSQLLVTPLAAPALQPRLPGALVLALPPGTERAGRVEPIPVPPPRSA